MPTTSHSRRTDAPGAPKHGAATGIKEHLRSQTKPGFSPTTLTQLKPTLGPLPRACQIRTGVHLSFFWADKDTPLGLSATTLPHRSWHPLSSGRVPHHPPSIGAPALF